MADKDWKKRLEAIGNTPMDDTSKRIMAGIEASKKRNAELAAENVKRRKNEESGYTKKSETESKSATKRSAVSSAKSTAAVAAATTVRQHKGGGATAEVDTAKVERQTKAEKATAKKKSQTPKKNSNPNIKYKDEPTIKVSEREPEVSVTNAIRGYGRNPKGVRDSQTKLAKGILTAPLRYLNRKTEEQLGITHPKKTSTGRRVLSSSDSEAQKERAAKGARRTRRLGKILSKLKGVSEGEKYEEHKRTWARHYKRGLTIKDSRK